MKRRIKPMTASTGEALSTTIERPTAMVWYVEPFGEIDQPVTFILVPGETNVMVVRGPLAQARKMMSELRAETGYAIWATNGVRGLAATDPHWDGKPTHRCSHCDQEHDVHENVAQELYSRGAKNK